MPQVQCSWEWLYRAGMFLGSPAEKRARILLPKQSSACSLPFFFPGHLWTRLGWGRLPIPNICFSQGAYKDSSAHTWLTNNSTRLKLVSGKDFRSSLTVAGCRPPLVLGVCKMHSRSPAAGLANLHQQHWHTSMEKELLASPLACSE